MARRSAARKLAAGPNRSETASAPFARLGTKGPERAVICDVRASHGLRPKTRPTASRRLPPERNAPSERKLPFRFIGDALQKTTAAGHATRGRTRGSAMATLCRPRGKFFEPLARAFRLFERGETTTAR
ncbi:hypothetical protein MTO96_018860 [Rhipicephalus appendiculatus]